MKQVNLSYELEEHQIITQKTKDNLSKDRSDLQKSNVSGYIHFLLKPRRPLSR